MFNRTNRTSHTPGTDAVAVPARRSRTRMRRLAGLLLLPATTVAFATLQPVSAHAATNAVGSISVQVGCSARTGQSSGVLSVYPAALTNPNYASQIVSYEVEFYNGGRWYTSAWSQPAPVISTFPGTDAYGHTITTVSWDALGSQSWNVRLGSGSTPVNIQGAFWDGHQYWYTGWVPAWNYIHTVNGSNLSQGPAPCGF